MKGTVLYVHGGYKYTVLYVCTVHTWRVCMNKYNTQYNYMKRKGNIYDGDGLPAPFNGHFSD